MTHSDDKEKIIRLFKEHTTPTTGQSKNNVHVVGNKNFVINDSKDVILNFNSPQRSINKITPTEEHITSAQARKIQEIVKSLAEKETASGMSIQRGFAKWYGVLKSRYSVPSYHLIPRHLNNCA
ncbi:hypothetical protein Bresa_00639|uniref:Uncharacterized protein n=1 Tax=Brenneria salicis ATCC 15712 = DSM 30166 TaxID=714314 RepID=A0A366I9C0_9GAMM|nr:hypothetical protein [Brenneria salicis]NMN90562.1 hypothetical protein [Brenneria salicis ATCC 15712 = DSM 30166]RBP64894.1 hypothetical protein DES54_106119 [Brenneria salicis ATCC 15712 = DSM 30166]